MQYSYDQNLTSHCLLIHHFEAPEYLGHLFWWWCIRIMQNWLLWLLKSGKIHSYKNQHLSIQKYRALGLALNRAKTIFPTFARSFTTCLLTFAPVHKIWSTIFTWASRYNQNLACRLFRVYSLHMHEPSHQSTQPYKLFHTILINIKHHKRKKSTSV